jgi:hypothetical protein
MLASFLHHRNFVFRYIEALRKLASVVFLRNGYEMDEEKTVFARLAQGVPDSALNAIHFGCVFGYFQ